MKNKLILKPGQLVVLNLDHSYTVSTSNKGGHYCIKPGVVGMFLGYTETNLSYDVAIVLFEDATMALMADKLKAHED